MAPNTIINKAVFINSGPFTRPATSFNRGPYRVIKGAKAESRRKSKPGKEVGAWNIKKPVNEQPDEWLKKELDCLQTAVKFETQEIARKMGKVEEIRKELVRLQAAKEEPQEETWVQEHNEEKAIPLPQFPCLTVTITTTPLPTPTTTVKLYLLNGGSMTAEYHKLHAGEPPAKEFRMYNRCFLIHHAAQKRHAHFDHARPISGIFPDATAYFGPGTSEYCSPGHISDSLSPWDGRCFDPNHANVPERWETLSGPWMPFGPFEKAIDFFGDGSFWAVSAPGQMPGNLCAGCMLLSRMMQAGWRKGRMRF
ncbi:hypothetical protein BJX66DRAFT_334977 [Aspergillus keveii]|uniref:Uncharacterized protein n=1 Tax=Aspergillus keveii TaxID=714993 RepID=A0ABR4GED9_9EURO